MVRKIAAGWGKAQSFQYFSLSKAGWGKKVACLVSLAEAGWSENPLIHSLLPPLHSPPLIKTRRAKPKSKQHNQLTKSKHQQIMENQSTK
jgi:hypothetical protein